VLSERNSVFISYAHQDSGYFNRLQVHIRPLVRSHSIEVWDETRINTESNWRSEIENAIKRAKVAILLISADFLALDLIIKNELPPLLDEARLEGAVILLVVVGHCRFKQTESLSKFQAVNNPSRPLSILPVAEREGIWFQVSENVEAALLDREETNEQRILEALEKLINNGIDGSFLIIEAEDHYHYVQFLYIHSKRSIICEAVSDEFLPEKSKLSEEDKSRLLELKFNAPSQNRNYNKELIIENLNEVLSLISAMTVHIFAEVYHLGKNCKLDFISEKYG